MATDTTAQYRQGVLVGNWNEDTFGSQLAFKEPIVQHGQKEMYKTVQKSSFTTGVKDGIGQYYEQRVQPEMHKGVKADLLFSHKGADTVETRYKTTYNTSWSQPDGADAPDPTLRKSKISAKRAQWDAESAAGSRFGAVTTENKVQFNESNSIIATGPNDKTHLRTQVLEKTFAQPHRKLRLRTE